MRHLVLGTAGHIDHGKSSLVRALTGIDPDRLQEEKRRGITIDLGFADLDLGGGRTLSFVDVPGHERFVRHMVAGATGVEAVLLVVAADQGAQRQTREHLDICRLLGLTRGIVALTKCDLAEPELRQVVALELGELLGGTFLERAPLLPVSATTGAGLDRLRAALEQLCDSLPPRATGGVPRLPVDRSFVMKGFGTVVTGTLASGRLVEGQEIAVLPGERRGRIRGLQVHGQSVSVAQAGQRAAVNLQGLDCADVPRGSTICPPGALRCSRRAWARLVLLPGAPETLRKGGDVRFHHGTTDGGCRLRVRSATSDGTLLVELHLAGETVLAPGDRFILRRPSPVDTVGGGVIVDAHPPRSREFAPADCGDDAMAPQPALRRRLERAGPAGRAAADLAAELGLAADELEALLVRLSGAGELVRAGPRWFDGPTWERLSQETVEQVASFHRERPLRAGISREVLRGRLCRTMPQEAWRELLERLVTRRALRLDGDSVALAAHAVVLEGAELELARRIETSFREAGLEPPELEQVVATADRERAAAIVDQLVSRGDLVRIRDGRLFHGEALERLRGLLREFARTSATIDVAGFKQLTGVTRKNAIPLLEQMDAERVTRRVGNLREILVARGE